jgi:hypothetical protein
VFLLAGCGGGSGHTSTDPGAGAPSVGSGPGATIPPGAELPPPPPPPAAGARKKLLPANAVLLGSHGSGCSHAQSPGGAPVSRWCAISMPATSSGPLELWVIDVSAAVSPGADVKCDGSSPHCLRLTDKLFADSPGSGPSYPTAHEFYGDTLVYYVDNGSGPFELYQGVVHAWRPGWTAGRPITSAKGVLCNAHERAPVAVCIENVSDLAADTVSWDLHGGVVGGGPLAKLATIYPVNPDTGSSQWRTGFTQAGDYLLYSTPPTATGKETLYHIRTADIGSVRATMVGTDMAHWNVNAAGTKLFYLRDYQYIPGEPSGVLHTSDFPAGKGERRIEGSQINGGAGGMGLYQVLVDATGKDAGLGLLNLVGEGRGNYRIINDPAGSYDDPANFTTPITDLSLRRLPVFSPGLGFALYARDLDDFVGTTDAWVVRRDGSGACALTTSLNSWLFGYPFVSESGLVVWVDNFDPVTDAGEGWVASADGCSGKRRFATGIDYWFVKDAALVLYSDDSDGRLVTLRIARIENGQWPASVTEIERAVERMYAVVGDYEGVLYKMRGPDEATAGVYHFQF